MLKDLRQVDLAFQKKLQGLEIEGVEVPVLYIAPEKEFQLETYPAIIFFRSGAYPDNSRWWNDTIKFNPQYDISGNLKTIDEKENPIPYNIYYSIRLYYDNNQDGAIMNGHIMRVLKRGAFVPIDDDEYDIIFVSYKNPNATYREFGVIKANKPREFIDQFLFKIEMNLDAQTAIKTSKFLDSKKGIVVRPPKINYKRSGKI